MNAQSAQRYEAILKHSSEPVTYREFFDDADAAKEWIYSWWDELCNPLDVVDTLCAAAIYDQHNSMRCIFTLGALRLLDK